MRRASPSKYLPSLVALIAIAAVPAAAQPRSVDRAVTAMERASGAPIAATIDRNTGLVAFLATVPGRPIPTRLPASAAPGERARAFLADHGAAFGIFDPSQLVVLRASAIDPVGMEHVRLQQTVKGVPITGGELAVHLAGAAVVAVNANTVATAVGDLVPTLTPAAATAAAAAWLEENLGVTDAELSAPRLELLNPGLLEGRRSMTHLAWFVEARRVDLRRFLWIDAVGGKVLLTFSQLTDALDRLIYDANDPGDGVFNSLPGLLLRTEGGAAVVGAAATDANDAYDFAGDTYDFFFDQHGRDSYDDAGASLHSTVRFCPSAAPADCPYFNAFWNGTQMVYGAGFPAADDVVAHELTHAVTEHTANLFYYMQSGALNESYSDIFGETVDLLNGAGTDTAGVRWQMGEDVPVLGAIRDMSDPTVFGDPGKLSDSSQFHCGDSHKLDTGGVHSNSGVPNHAYALLVDGGSYNGFTVGALGLTKASKVQYRALAHYLLSASDFLDNAKALVQSCSDLVGIAGITVADCAEVADAIAAVEMEDTWPCTPTQAAVPSLCPDGQAPEIFQSFDFEDTPIPACPSSTVPGGWCTNGPTSLLGAFATSGVRSGWGYNQPAANLQTLTVGLGTVLPANARLQFNHSAGFENSGGTFWDGGVIEVSTNGGSTWSDGGGLITDGQTYGGTIPTCCSNPLGGRSAFVGETWGFTASQLDLSSLGGAGSAFAYRFGLGTDASVDDYGWFLDDLRLYTCDFCEVNRILDAAYNGGSSLYRATDTVTAGDGFTVGVAEDVTFEAGQSIVLTDGFRVAGGSFTARIEAVACP